MIRTKLFISNKVRFAKVEIKLVIIRELIYLRFIKLEKLLDDIKKGKNIFNFVASTSHNEPGERQSLKVCDYPNIESGLYIVFTTAS